MSGNADAAAMTHLPILCRDGSTMRIKTLEVIQPPRTTSVKREEPQQKGTLKKREDGVL